MNFSHNNHLDTIGYGLDCYVPGLDKYTLERIAIERQMKEYEDRMKKREKNPIVISHHYDWEQFLEYVD